MKTFTFKKTEHHQMSRFYDATLDEDEVLQIFLEDHSESEAQELLEALQDPAHGDHDTALEIIMNHDIVFDRWEWLDEDDIWTDRKGGYDVTYEYEGSDEAEDSDTTLPVPQWPFPHVTVEEQEKLAEDTKQKAVLALANWSESGDYEIKIYSRGLEAGIAKITHEQYEYWRDQDEDLLADALNQNLDYDSIPVPPAAQFEGYYNDYYDQGVFGPSLDNSHVEIISPSGQTIYDGELGILIEYIDVLRGRDEDSCISPRLSIWLDELDAGYYLQWQQGGKGLYFEGSTELSEFDFTKLTFTVDCFEGQDVVTAVYYGDQEIENSGGEWSGKYSLYSVHEVE